MQIMVRLPDEASADEQGRDWAILEMQGDLESRLGTDENLAGKFIGDLHFNKSDGTPVLIIGHHILNGKVVDIQNPLLVMRKKSSTQIVSADGMEVDNKPTETEYIVESIVRKKILFKARPKPIIANVKK